MTAWISSLRSRLHATRWWKHLKLFILFTVFYSISLLGILFVFAATFPAPDHGPMLRPTGVLKLIFILLEALAALAGVVMKPVAWLLGRLHIFEALGIHSAYIRAAFLVLISATFSTWAVAFVSSRIRKPPPVVPDADEASKP